MDAKANERFATEQRLHMGFAVKNLQQSIEFYTSLFGVAPNKTRRRYARFEPSEPPVNLSLHEVEGDTRPNNPLAHFGIQLKTREGVQRIADRLRQAGRHVRVEENVSCCYALQDKAWVSDPDGANWEVYVVLDDNGQSHASSQSSCCSEPEGAGVAGAEACSCSGADEQ